MSVSMTCRHCNIEIVADDPDELVKRVQEHALAHPRPVELTREHILARLQRQQTK